MNEYLANITPEQRAENLEKARRAREEKKKAGEHLKQDWMDEQHFRALASKYGVRLPLAYIPATEVKYIKRIMKKLEIDPKMWLEAEGYRTLGDFGKNNPTTPAWVHCGLLLEWWDEVTTVSYKQEKV